MQSLKKEKQILMELSFEQARLLVPRLKSSRIQIPATSHSGQGMVASVDISGFVDPSLPEYSWIAGVLNQVSNVLPLDIDVFIKNSQQRKPRVREFYSGTALFNEPVWSDTGDLRSKEVKIALSNYPFLLFEVKVMSPQSWIVRPASSDFDLNYMQTGDMKPGSLVRYEVESFVAHFSFMTDNSTHAKPVQLGSFYL